MIVVGAGPTGLILALNLARAGIPVDVLEAASEVDEALRAAFHSAPGVRELRRAGVLEDVRTVGFIQTRFDYRKLDGTLLASLDPDDLPADYPDKRTCLPVGQLCVILRKHLAKHKIARVFYDHPVVKVSQDEYCAWAEVETADGDQLRFSADYVVGCDGGRSIVRRSLFGERVFPGYSWDKQIVTTNVSPHSLTSITIPADTSSTRSTSPSRSSAGQTSTSSSTRSTGTWLVSSQTTSGV